MSKTYYSFNLARLPAGTTFYVVNGAWNDEVILKDGVKHLVIAGDLDNPRMLTDERGKRCKVDIRIEYLSGRVEPLPFDEGATYTDLDVMELPVGTTFYVENGDWYGEIVVSHGHMCLWEKETGDIDIDMKSGKVIGHNSYVIDKVTVNTLGEDIAGRKEDRNIPEDEMRRKCFEMFKTEALTVGDWLVDVVRNDMSLITKESDIDLLRDFVTNRGKIYRKATPEEIRLEKRTGVFETEGRMLDGWKIGDAVENGGYGYGRVVGVNGDEVRVLGMGEKEWYHKSEITPAFFIGSKPKGLSIMR